MFWSENLTHGQVNFKSSSQFHCFSFRMGQKTSCLSSESKPAAYKTVNSDNRTLRTEVDQRTAPARFTNISSEGKWNSGVVHNALSKGGVVRTRTTESDCDEDNHIDKKSGYILVDLKGEKVVHVDQDYLVGCEIYAPGLGIGLIVASISDNKFTIHYKVQMADGRHVVVAIRRCEEDQITDMSVLNTRLFIMQRLY